MTKSTSSTDAPPTSPSASGGVGSNAVFVADDGYAVVSKATGFSPSETALPQIPCEGTSGSLGSLGSLGEEVLFIPSAITVLNSEFH